MSRNAIPGRQLTHTLLDTLIRAGLIAALVVACYQVFSPFLSLMIWALILAVTLYPLHNMLKARTGHSDSRAATLLVVLAIAVLLIPIYLLGTSLTESVQTVIATVKEGGVHIPPPPDAVAQWPLIGKPLHGFWAQVASDLTGVLQRLAPQLKDITLSLLGKAAGIGIGMLVFIAALMIAGIIMAFGETGHSSARRIATRVIAAERGDQLVDLCTATIRAVAQGVIGIAFIQMLLIGAGFVFMGVPGAGLLALAVLLLGIMQLPATLITLPVIAFVFFSEGASLATIVFAIYVFVAGLADNVLKPLLLGRGVDVPMPVVLIGALGGMVTGGIIGLFIGPVLLAVGYKLFWEWVDTPSAGSVTGPQDGE
ncbi:AI-2E family transporter [Pseudomonas sp. R-28-1W-6]|jgi:predicted PurR-regulated permease PerM|uniref:AI-2E family transporter n=1 Tax=Pseudomonas sp. R-28-1W-6 TaxID=2650101 RepID=UPI0013653ED1|nr:AI-2E family transporter [Pseudomonas sp. R-28-1W-6]MWV13458.1 AI-2E family transporter [Pseudomonas sp. R-28-1W-6]